MVQVKLKSVLRFAREVENFIFRFQFFIENGRIQAFVRASTRDAYNLYSVNFFNHRFHTIGKYVQTYRYRLSTDMANIGPIPIPIIGQSLIFYKWSTDLLQVDCQNLLSTGLLKFVSTSCNKSTTDKPDLNKLVVTSYN